VTNIFIRNLDSEATEEQLRTLFEGHGTVGSVTIVKDRDTGQSRGFAFVEMPSAEEARAAITGVNGIRLNDRILQVNEARPRLVEEPGRASNGTRDHRRHQV
jgi:RNA recognition motif-containing protein